MNARNSRFLFGTTIALVIPLLLLVLPMPTPARAGGTVTTCTEAELVAALAGGGTVMFNCGGTNSPATIVLTSQKTISVSTTINGGSVITLSGGNSTPLFLVNSGVTLTLNAITITQGHTSGHGGCLYVNGTLVVDAMTMTNCNAGGASSRGGAIYLDSGARATFVNTRVLTNTATIYGGGIYNYAGSAATLTNVTLSGNHARYGGGILNDGTLTLTNMTLSGNTSLFCGVYTCDGDGGGIDNTAPAAAALTNVTLSGNSAGLRGGGILNDGTLTLNNVTLSGNTASFCLVNDLGIVCGGGGGGIYNDGTATLTNVTLSGNSSGGCGNVCSGTGGGIFNAGTTTLTNVTLSGNQSYDVGGGIYRYSGTVTLKNTIVANSSGGNCLPFLGGNFNLSSDGTCGFGADRDNVSVMLGPLANNGGATLTHALLPGSPAIDFGTDAGCPSTDQRGAHRPIGTHCDVGAYEAGYLFLPLIMK